MPFKSAKQSGLSGRGKQRSVNGLYPVKATGGTITRSSGYIIHTFNDSGTFTPHGTFDVEYLVVAGGGGGGRLGGGGGGGGVRSGTGFSVSATGYTITVGGGGAGVNDANGTKGSDSVFSTITATGSLCRTP